jgi:hypothetical protein
LWAVISAPRYLELCHPFCEANQVLRWPGADAEDVIHYYGGRVVQRHFTGWFEGSGYDVRVTTPEGIAQANVWWRIEGASDTASQLTVTLQPLFLDHLPHPIRWMQYPIVRLPMLTYLKAVVAGVVHHTETGERVQRNQFGAHRWFSPAT